MEIVALNNTVTIRKDRDLMDSLKRLKNVDTTVLLDKLNPAQQDAILANRTLLLCLMNKVRVQKRMMRLIRAYDVILVYPTYVLFRSLDGRMSRELGCPEEAVSSIRVCCRYCLVTRHQGPVASSSD